MVTAVALSNDGQYLVANVLTALVQLADADTAVRVVVQAALDSGSRDNITAVIADVAKRAEPDEGWLDALAFDPVRRGYEPRAYGSM
jgi:serine/threonine protein phosphatase PrpC